MAASLKLLNDVQKQIIKMANESGIQLKDHFKNGDDFKQFVFSFTLKSLVDIGKIPFNQAYDMVMGDGSYKQLSDELWEKMSA